MPTGILMEGKNCHKLCNVAFAMLLLFPFWSAQAEESPRNIDEQRALFKTAQRALHLGKVRDYRRLESKLADYPLYPYLRYEYLRGRLAQVQPTDVRTFLTKYSETPVATQLQRAWLHRLARRKKWPQYLKDYSPDIDNDRLRCQYVNALIHSGQKEEAWREADTLWHSGRSQPGECDAVFDAWRKAGQLTHEKVLSRMELALEHNRTRLFSYLSRFLPRSDKRWVKRWQRMRRYPESQLKHLKTTGNPAWSARLFVYGVTRLARRDAISADRYWARRDGYRLSTEQLLRGERTVALNLAMQRQPDGYRRLSALARNGANLDRNLRHWRVRSALWHEDWEEVLAALAGLSGEERGEADWNYWRGRALEALGHRKEASTYYQLAAQTRSYYGFLAAARAGQAPYIVSEPLKVTDAEREALQQSPVMQRVRELNKLDMTLAARREWRDAMARMDSRTLRVAAKIAHENGWHDQAILALGRTEYLDHLEVRFPTPYQDEVHRYAEKRNLDPAFVYAVMRQESAFGVHARSPVGALGLMQLMPATARRTARSIRERAPSRAELLTAEKNIRIGTAYLSKLLDRYSGNRFFALAAYNAGPGRVRRWQPKVEPKPADIWVANITFAETREYIERILAYTAVYEWRLGKSVTPVTDWLADAPPRFIREASSGKGQTDLAQLTPPG